MSPDPRRAAYDAIHGVLSESGHEHRTTAVFQVVAPFLAAPCPVGGELDPRVREALEFYADEKNYDDDLAPGEWLTIPSNPSNGGEEHDFEADHGARAREALALLPPARVQDTPHEVDAERLLTIEGRSARRRILVAPEEADDVRALGHSIREWVPAPAGGRVQDTPAREDGRDALGRRVWIGWERDDGHWATAEDLREAARDSLIGAATGLVNGLLVREGVSRSQLAKRIGKTPGFVTQVLNGERNMTLSTLADLCAALNYAPSLAASSLPVQDGEGRPDLPSFRGEGDAMREWALPRASDDDQDRMTLAEYVERHYPGGVQGFRRDRGPGRWAAP